MIVMYCSTFDVLFLWLTRLVAGLANMKREVAAAVPLPELAHYFYHSVI